MMKKELTQLKVFLQRNDKIVTNSLRLAFPPLAPRPSGLNEPYKNRLPLGKGQG